MRTRTVLRVVAIGLLMSAIPVKADYVVFSDGITTITAVGDPVVLSNSDPDPWAQTFTLAQGTAWDQFGVQYVSGLGGGFASPDLSAFSPDSFSVILANADFGLTSEHGSNLSAVSETFTVTFMGSSPTAGVFKLDTFYQGIGERDMTFTGTLSSGKVTFAGILSTGQGENGGNGYTGAVPLSAFTPLPSSARMSLLLFGGLALGAGLKNLRRFAAIG